MATEQHNDEEMRWARAAALARGKSLSPRGQGVDPRECEHIEQLAERIESVGEDQAWVKYQATKGDQR
jgi:hypothetical protein